MKASDDCPGPGRCHGPASWCDVCGDVDLICDDPACFIHDRLDELEKRRDEAFERYHHLGELRERAGKEYVEAAEKLRLYKQGKPRIVPRGSTDL